MATFFLFTCETIEIIFLKLKLKFSVKLEFENF